jgi:hypothetical protein
MYKYSLGKLFAQELARFPDPDILKVKYFLNSYIKQGFNGLNGKNRSSDNVHRNDPFYLSKVKYAQEHKLWHYHIGIPKYEKSEYGDYLTSEYVLHYQKLTDYEIKIVDMSYHPPLNLPNLNYLI